MITRIYRLTDNLYETRQHCFDDSAAKHTRLMMTFTEENPNKIDTLLTRVG